MRNALALSLLLGVVSVSECTAATRRAVVVGINRYEGHKAAASGRATAGLVPRKPIVGTGARSDFADLDGAVNDANDFAALLSSRYHFNHVKVLLNEQATAQNILDTFQRELIDGAGPDDISVFFYAGHGSEIRNTGTQDGRDQTLVPYDAPDGVADIRDKELARLYLAAARKGIYLTVIADSCHSGGLSRGSRRFAKVRVLPDDPRSVNDPWEELDAAGKKLYPTMKSEAIRHPVLVLASAEDNQAAEETEFEGKAHGVFSAAFLQTLRNSPERESAGALFTAIRAMVRSQGRVQIPVLSGEARTESDLFGQPSDSTAGVVVAIAGMFPDGTFRINGGSEAGLFPGCELKTIAPPDVRLRITAQANLGESVAQVIAGDAGGIAPGQKFQLDKWVVPREASLLVQYAKDGPALDELKQTAAAISQMRSAAVELVRDPTAETPTYDLWWEAGNWRLAPNRGGTEVKLGRTVDAARLHRLLGDNAHLFVNYPMPASDAAKLALGQGTPNDAVGVKERGAGVDYILAGAWTGRNFEYAWIRPGVSDADQAEIKLPVRTDWIALEGAAGVGELTAKAMQLNRIKGWLNLGTIGGGSGAGFPYHLALRRVGAAGFLREGHTTEGDRFKVWLTATAPDIVKAGRRGNIEQRWIYVMALDRDGEITRVIPRENANVGNRLPDEGAHPAEIQLTDEPYDFEVSEPVGLDTYILLSSVEPIDPNVLNAKGVRTRSGSRGAESPLTSLLGNIGVNSRGTSTPPAVPTTWSIESISFRSVKKTPAAQ